MARNFPIFIAHKRFEAGCYKPALFLYGYGGFNVSETPTIALLRPRGSRLEVSMCRLRSGRGGEYGGAWHDAVQTLKKRQNVFDDFIAASLRMADRQQIQSSLPLKNNGGPNGGLLVGLPSSTNAPIYLVPLQTPQVGVMGYVALP
jgi:prolyl oligopeptidase